MSDRWIVLGFYQDHSAADCVLNQLRGRHLGRSVSIHRAQDGSITTSQRGLPKSLVARYKQWVVRNETLIAVRVRPHHLDNVLDLLRNNTGSLPITFAFHDEHRYLASSEKEPLHLPPLTVEAMRLAASQLAAVLVAASPRAGRGQSLSRRLVDSESDLKQVYRALASRSRTEQPTAMSAVW